MITNEAAAQKLAAWLLQIKAIKLQPEQPFQWSSGWLSPIYTDNRVTLSHPEVRNFIRRLFIEVVEARCLSTESISGVATGGIAHGVLLAQEWNCPFLYVRPSEKKHGIMNRIEGDLTGISESLVVEDLVSTGQSSLNAVGTLRSQGIQVNSMVSIFNYGFEESTHSFSKAGVQLYSLCSYDILLSKAQELGYISQDDLSALSSWRKSPSEWGR
jgi:orotate phosphoribosyltransferase